MAGTRMVLKSEKLEADASMAGVLFLTPSVFGISWTERYPNESMLKETPESHKCIQM